MTNLFTPFSLRQRSFANRLVVAPMCQYSAVDGVADDYHLVHLGRFALGGFAAVIVEATGVTAEGRITAGCLGLWDDRQIGPLRRIVDFIHRQGKLAGIQLAHAGRKGSSRVPWRGLGAITPDDADLGHHGWMTLAPSARAHMPSYAVPKAMDSDDIYRTIDAFGLAAARARQAGFDFVEIHGAHGYLINQFLSPVANGRSDGWGGSRDNRMRLALAVAERVRAEWPADRPLLTRLSMIDGIAGGWTIEDSVVLAGELARRGVDMIHGTAGGFDGATLPSGAGFLLPLAARLKRESGVPVMAVGAIATPEIAARAIDDGSADMVALARPALDDPNFPLHARIALGAADWSAWPVQAGYAVRRLVEALGR